VARRVVVTNLTAGRAIAGRVAVAGGPGRRLLGLMGQRQWRGLDGLLLEPCNSVHTFFMRMPIDVLYLDRGGLVVRLVHNLRPWRLGPIVWRAHRVVELPAGTLERAATQLGHRIAIEPSA
jgi:uncharacterized membrane protein (UPF0127 family)